MKYPTLYEIENTRESIEIFKGMNRNLRIEEGEFSDMENLCSDRFPVMTPRDKRRILPFKNTVDFMFMNNYLWREVSELGSVDNYLYRNNDKVMTIDLCEDHLTSQVAATRGMIYFGSYILLGNGQYINTEDYEDTGNINVRNTNGGKNVTLSLCKADGTSYSGYISSTTAPESPTDGAYWIDTSGDTAVLKQYSAGAAMWVTIATTYVKITCEGIGANLAKYDGVQINSYGLQEWLDGSHVLWDAGDDYLVVTGILNSTVNFTTLLEVKRELPELSYWFECGNRVWGVCGNEIRASKLGDFKNWECYMGLSTDSYAVSVGSQGYFTGGINYLGYPLFFKGDRVYRVYGSYPAEYQVKDTVCQGVAPGMWKSLAIVNQTLFYVGADGVYSYDGSAPTKISYALGETLELTDVVSGAMGHKYVMAAVPAGSVWHDGTVRRTNLYVYDLETGLWHKEYAGTFVRSMESLGNGVLYLAEEPTETYEISYTIYWIGGSAYTVTWDYSEEEDPVEWYGETGVLGMGLPDRKYISRVLVRMSMEAGSAVKFFIQYDSKGPWEHMGTLRSPILKTVTIPLRPHRCDHFRIRIEGTGYAEVYSITKTIEQGSDQ